MEFRPATQEDLAYVRANPFEAADKLYHDFDVPDENTYCVTYESSIVAVGGLHVVRPGVGRLWLILTADSKKDGLHGLKALHAIQEKTEHLLKTNNIYRAEAHIRVDFDRAIKMIEFLGFQKEGTMREFFPDRVDGYLYARIIK